MFGNDYESRRVVVTGAASGMGAAVCDMLLELGAEVIGADIKEIENPALNAYQLNLMEQASIDAFVAEQADESIYALFCCAGLPQTFPPVEVVQVNFLGNRYLIEALLPKLQRDGGRSRLDRSKPRAPGRFLCGRQACSGGLGVDQLHPLCSARYTYEHSLPGGYPDPYASFLL